jgi:hypothetical protein
VPPASQNSTKTLFFVKTTIEWNSLTDEQLSTVAVSRQCDQCVVSVAPPAAKYSQDWLLATHNPVQIMITVTLDGISQ